MSASRTRRQMIQRMGRILRRKRPGVAARFVIMFAKDTLEDPANRIERDGFLDEIERISEATGVFDGAQLRGARRVPRRARPASRARAGAPRALRARRRGAAANRPASSRRRRARRRRRRAAYAFLASPTRSQPTAREPAIRKLDARLPRPEARRAVSRGRARRRCREIAKPQGQAEALVDRAGAARDRAHRVGVADQLHRVRRSRHRSSSSGGRSSTRPCVCRCD